MKNLHTEGLRQARSTKTTVQPGARSGIRAGRNTYSWRVMPKDRRSYLPYSPELADRVCELMVEGRSLRQICGMSGMPSRRSVFNWLEKNEEFRQKYEIARLMQVECWTHEIIEIADDTSGDFVINERGERVVDHENINRARLKIDARKWLMSKLHPQRYGDRVTADVTVRREVRELSEVELLQIASSAAVGDDGEGGTVH